MAGELHVPLPSTMSSVVDGDGNVTMAWRAWFTMVDKRVGGFTLPSGVIWTSGTGAPIAAQPVGSLYSREDGTVGATLYLSHGGGTWAAIG